MLCPCLSFSSTDFVSVLGIRGRWKDWKQKFNTIYIFILWVIILNVLTMIMYEIVALSGPKYLVLKDLRAIQFSPRSKYDEEIKGAI